MHPAVLEIIAEYSDAKLDPSGTAFVLELKSSNTSINDIVIRFKEDAEDSSIVILECQTVLEFPIDDDLDGAYLVSLAKGLSVCGMEVVKYLPDTIALRCGINEASSGVTGLTMREMLDEMMLSFCRMLYAASAIMEGNRDAVRSCPVEPMFLAELTMLGCVEDALTH